MQFDQLRRRDFVTLLGVTVAWPLMARAQQAERVRRIGVLSILAENDPASRKRMAAFLQALQKLGWREGDNFRIDYRYALGKADDARRVVAELVALAPDVILATGSLSTNPLLEVTRTVPVVFVIVVDPVGAGFVESLARPGGNATGFMQMEYALSGKWLELLKEIAPRVTQVGVLRDLSIAAGAAQFAVIQAAAALLHFEVSPIGVREVGEIERGITAFARGANGGLIVTAGPMTAFHRDLIVALADRHKLPAVYWDRSSVTEGGLISFGPDFVDQYRQAAGYVDRILRGAKPADLPVQAPVKYELVVNLKTAKAQGIVLPDTVLGRADEIIE